MNDLAVNLKEFVVCVCGGIRVTGEWKSGKGGGGFSEVVGVSHSGTDVTEVESHIHTPVTCSRPQSCAAKRHQRRADCS